MMENVNAQGSEKRELKIERLNLFYLIIFLVFYPSLARISCYLLTHLTRGYSQRQTNDQTSLTTCSFFYSFPYTQVRNNFYKSLTTPQNQKILYLEEHYSPGSLFFLLGPRPSWPQFQEAPLK